MATRENAPLLIVLLAACWLPVGVVSQTMPNGAAIDGEVSKIMTQTHANGLAVAVIDHGKVRYVHAYGVRNAKGDPLDYRYGDVWRVSH
jgi:CubicO group peptidase (beta-lactamase class C family)